MLEKARSSLEQAMKAKDLIHHACVSASKAGEKELSRGPFAPKFKLIKKLKNNFGAKGPLDISLAPVLSANAQV